MANFNITALIVFVLINHTLVGPFQFADAQCTWPSQFVSSTWVDNVHGDLVFGTTTMSGWSFTISTSGAGQSISDWQCVISDQFDTDGYLVMRSVSDFTLFVTSQYYAYVCLKMKKITDYSYRFYILEPEQGNINFERYLISPSEGLSTLDTTCFESFGASGSESRILIKSGSESQAKVTCPWIFLGRFDYYHTENGVSTCTAGNNDLDVCTDKEMLEFDFAQCSTDVAYSGQTSVACVDNVPVGSDTFVTTYSTAAVDGVNTFKFSCFGISGDLRTVSVAPEYCRKNQVTNSASSDGALITVTSITELCRTCAALTDPDGGNVTIQTDGADTVAIYSCASEYDMYGDSTRTCQSDSTWTGSAPVCKCKFPSIPINGNVTVSSDGLIATYTCNPGYVLTGNQYRACQANGNAWNGTDPSCDTCDILANISNGVTQLSFEGVSSIASFYCDVNYSLSGARTVVCKTDGTWNDTTPTCVVCSPLSSPTLGGMNMMTDGYQTTASFHCEAGYQISGLETLTCQTDGTWNGTEPICVCEVPLAPVSGSVSVSADGMTATYMCDLLHTMVGQSTRECLLNGSSWTTSPPKCETCTNLTEAAGAVINYTTDGIETMARYTCLSGYTLNGDQTTTCTSDGSWSQTASFCAICPTVASPDAGSVLISTNGTVSKATYTCLPGYNITGDTTLTCQTDGTWTGTEPTCECSTPDTPDNGDVIVNGNVAQYTCKVGYTLNSLRERFCLYDGSGWNGTEPTCGPCSSLTAPTGGSYILESHTGLYTYASFICDLGYTVDGITTLACQSDGTWNGSTPACSQCDQLASPGNGSVNLTTDGQTTQAVFTCDQGTSLSHTSTRSSQCNTDGTWSSSSAICVTCDSLSEISSGNVTYTTNGTTTVVDYTCVAGYNLNGVTSRLCLSNGSWTESEPRCVCDSPGEIIDGSLNIINDSMIAIYICDVGYSMFGSSTLNCQTDGSGWDLNPPSCYKCSDLVGLSNGNVTVSSNGTQSFAIFLCDTGYTLNGTNIRTCDTDGTWTLTAPSCVLCSSLSNPEAGSHELTYNGINTVATFLCDPGYQIHGASPSVLTCDNTGAWDSSEPNCVCDIPNAPANGNVTVSGDGLSAIYTCDILYTINGNDTRVCYLDGSTWSGAEPFCETCDTLENITQGSISYTSDGRSTLARFTCDLGSTLSGVNSRTCATDGSWNASQPACVECPSLGSLDSGQVSFTTDGRTTTAMFNCSSGYNLHGNISAQCLSGGIWSSSVPSCICEPPPVPDNGNFVLSNYNQTVTFTCNLGYILSGSSVRICNTDGSRWSGIQPSCVTCETVSSPGNGTVNIATNGIVTEAVFNCFTGSTLDGNSVLTCTENGTWDLEPPTCVTCSSLTDPPSGLTSIFTNGTLSVAEFTCSVGYDIVGSSSAICQSNGIWTVNIPECVCEPPSTPANGSMTISTDGMEVIYRCDIGTSLTGSVVRYCQNDGSGWSGIDPICASCAAVLTPSSGSYSLSTNGSVTTATFNCSNGFSLSGSTSITCLSSGFWSESSPTCVNCGSLTAPDSGTVTEVTNGVVTTVVVTCVSGYQINGTSTLTCLSDGTWDAVLPSCVCTAPSSPLNGNVEISTDMLTATYTCNSGYTLQGQSIRTCQTGGAGWTDTQPSCSQCDSLNNPVGGSITMATTGTVTEAIYSCNTGYTLNGGSTLTCRDDGSWDISVPTCVSCNKLTSPTNGAVTLTSDGSTTVANFSCSLGYTMTGSSLLTCKADGSWDFTSPACVQCLSLSTVPAGNTFLGTDGMTTTAVILCVSGYYLVGTATITCESDGNWSDTLPTCACEVPSTPVNGSLIVSNDGMAVIYSCDVGYSLVGDSEAICDQTGAGWSTTTPSCVHCADLNTQNNATASLDTNGTTTTITYNCDVGSTLSGTSTLICLDTGNWTSIQPFCAECPGLLPPTNGEVTVDTNGTMSVASFICNVGYSLSGSNTLTCQSDAKWDVAEPSCSKCDDLTAITSGNYNITTAGQQTTAVFTCVSGYLLDGSTQLTCKSDGKWDTIQPSCVCNTPASPSNGDIWVSSDGMTVTYNCDLGYTLQGETSNTCNTDGSGWLHGQPSCSQCQTLTSPANGNITLYTDGTITAALYMCADGYSLSNNNAVSVCENTGFWNLTGLSCVKCEDLVPPSSGSVNVVSTGSYTRATYSCMAGYDLEGVSQRLCQTNGSWDQSAPTCVCQNPSVPSNGGIVVSADKQTVSYSCDVGFSLNGVSARQCGTDGTSWTDTDPQCVICLTLSTVTGGNVAMTTDRETTTANHTCDSGYSMSGTSLLTCRNDGTWDFVVPSCVQCDTLTTTVSGSHSIITDGSTSTVTFQCNIGYSLAGSQQATCSSTGSWSSQEPDCVECTSLTSPSSGTVNITTDGITTSAVHTCSVGYSLVGSATLTCLNDGSWDNQQPSCVCDQPSSPSNGNVSIYNNGYKASFTCDAGYTLSGDSQITCLQDGSGWSDAIPTCEQCITVTAPENGTLTRYSDGVKTSIIISCDQGFSASSSTNLTCQGNGTFDGIIPECVKCSDLEAVSNGSQVFSSTGSQTTVTVTCDIGYSLEGQNTLTCDSNGSWTSTIPSCVQCGTFPTISSSSHVLNTNGTVTSSTVECTHGYVMIGSATVTCYPNGLWGTLPSCICEDPVPPVNGNVTSDGQIAVFTCDIGYSLNGSQLSYCGTDGSGWNTSKPVCVGCPAISYFGVGQSGSFTDGSSTYQTFSCPVGYTLTGNQTITCDSTGSWSSAKPSCTVCPTLTAPDNGNISITTDNVTTSVLYSCVTGYYLDGTAARTCTDNGTWSDSAPVCYCVPPSSPMNGQVEVSVDRTTVTYNCDVGYSLDGVSSRKCQNDSSGLSGLQPSCILCSTVPTPSGGQISTTTDGTTTSVMFTCESGYTLSGSQYLACRSDGSWNTSAPSCVTCDLLSYPTGGSYTISSDGVTSVVKYTCDNGYTLSGTNDIECSTTGQWIGQTPACVSCATLTPPSSGNMVTVTDGFTTTAIFSCNHGYYISSDANLTCASNGQWDATEPECYCIPPANITNGNYVLSVDQSEVTYSCDTGYTLNGSVSRSCETNGQGWTGADPECVQCTFITPPNGGNFVTSSNGSVSITTFTCDTGSTISGDITLECGPDGAWSSMIPDCAECSTPVSPLNGNHTLSSNGTHSVVEYSCDLGYSLLGDPSAKCESSSTWTSVTPQCVLCSTLNNISNGDIAMSTNGSVTAATFTCFAGYHLTGTGSLYCRVDGSWSDSMPACVCDPPLSIVNGNYTISLDGMTVDYTCDLGYTMSGSSSRSCGATGLGWSGSPPTCGTCDSLGTIDDGNTVLTTNGTHTTVMFECDIGYSMDSTDYQAACEADGSWNVLVPSCVQCPVLNTIVNGNVTLTSSGAESVSAYCCFPGYTLTGDQSRVCTQGTWNGTQPECLCTYSTYLANGNAVSDGSTISYTCQTGYTLNGPSNRTCQNDGTGWSLTEPVCVLCEPLTTLVAGNMSMITDGLETSAYFTCMKGYTLTGSSQLTCRSDGSWSSLEPSCGVSCTALSVPQGGNVSLETNGLTTTAQYMCDNGYSLVGSMTLTCRSDGSWDLTESSCVLCQTLTAPTSGSVVISTDGTTTVATYTCHADYYLEGSYTSVCGTDGNWNNQQPTCYCNSPLAPANGSVTLSMDKRTATFACTVGFTLQGEATVTCQNNSTGWSGNTPACVYCGAFTNLPNGTSNMVTDGAVTSVIHTCDTGYTLSGNQNITCLDNGTWLEQFPDCVLCTTLQSLSNGSTVLLSDGVQTTAEFTCNLGYSMLGGQLIHCLEDGSWNSSLPTCVLCESISAPSSGSISESTDGITSFASFTCSSGYHLEGNLNISCRSDGTWSGSAPLCVCDLPPSPTNGDINTGANTSIILYTCDTGFTLSGNPQRLCSDQGSGWMGIAPTCAQCEDLVLSSNLSVTLTTDGTTSLAVFECDLGYTLSGSDNLMCLENGTWSGTVPICVHCPDLTAPDSGNVTIYSNGSISMAEYTCSNGYMALGITTVVCTAGGSWDNPSPVCVCKAPASPVNGDVSSDGVTATYTCDTGYTIYGESSRTCQQSGLGWNGTQPSCTACSSLDSVAGGSVSMTTDSIMTMAQYTCDVGYTMFGTSILTCRSDGSWDFSDTQCVPCETLSSPNNGNINMMSDGDTTKALFTCDTGYTLAGLSSLICRTDGSWDFSEPACVKCTDLVDPDSGTVDVTSNGEISTALYTCMSGYYLNGGDSSRACGTDGVWNGTMPMCVCDPPVAPANGNITFSNGYMTVQFACEVGYTLSGSSLLVCQVDGSGWNSSIPACNKCDGFIDISNSSVEYVTDGQRWLAIVSCDTGTSLIGQSELECQANGTWHIMALPECVSCPDITSPNGGDVTINSNGSVTMADFYCDTNYSLTGSSHLECLTTGLWDNGSPSCVQCSSIDSPASGSAVFDSNGYTTLVTFSCIAGYELYGNSVLSCLHDGTWNGTQPSCACESPMVPTNGYISLSTDRLGVTFACDVGHSLSGSATSHCDVHGAGWNNTVPSCVKCAALSDISNGNITFQTDQVSTSASYTCGVGYTLSDDVIRSCLDDGSWTQNDPTCVSCPTLSSPLSGSVFISTNGAVSVAQYSCASGYDLQGVPSRTCQTSGQWNGTEPTCTCQLPTKPNNGNVTFGVNISVAIYSCDIGYSLNGTRQATCQTDGTGWDSVQPACVLCETLQNVAGATTELITDGRATGVTYSCDTGYTLVGEPDITCRSDGTWNVQPPSCVTCLELDTPEGGLVTMRSNNSVTQAVFACASGYTLQGTSVLTCRSTGTWDLTVPDCVMCPALEAPPSGTMNMSTDGQTTTVVFICSEGYYLDGTDTLTCLTNGLWDANSPSCKCMPPNTIENGSYNISDNGTVLTHSCNAEYSLIGDFIQNCDSNGNGWLGHAPNCSLCDSLSAQLNGSWSVSTDGISTLATFSCQEGFSMSGQSEIQCQPDGSWDSAQPSCEKCAEITTPLNGSKIQTTNGTSTLLTFNCDIGFTLIGSSELICLRDGSWSELVPTCVLCPTLIGINNGDVFVSTNGTVTTAIFSCTNGYSIHGNTELFCDITGYWSSASPTCVCDVFISPDNGGIEISDNGTIATFSCESGYTLSGDTTVTCEATLSNSGGNFTNPTCVTCSTLSASAGSTLTVSTDGQTTSAVVACDVGYTIVGSTNLTCRSDGTWDIQTPSCAICDSVSVPLGGNVTFNSDGTMTEASFLCYLGYTMVGSNTLTCRTDGSWNLEVPTCVLCQSLATPSNGQLSLGTDGSVTLATVTCDSNYYLQGDPVLTCATNGLWSGAMPSCVCVPPSSPENGNISLSVDGLNITYSCNHGYTLIGDSSQSCLDDGSGWSGVFPNCTKCADLQTLTNGTLTLTSNGVIAIATITCDLGYSIDGPAALTCGGNGTWNLAQPTCNICTNQSAPLHGNLEYHTNGSVTYIEYSCDIGYTLAGNNSAYCMTDGTWDSTQPSCVFCPELGSVDNGNLQESSNRTVTTATYSCISGYSIVGESLITCLGSGQWSHNPPVCFCDDFAELTNGNIQVSDNGTQATYSCPTGYTLYGDQEIICGTTSPTYTVPSCTLCDSVTVPTGASVTMTTDNTTTVATFVCDTGYSIVGDSTLTCRSDGTWHVSPPSCVSCQTLGYPDGSNISISSINSVTVATISCSTGYTLNGAKSLTCRSDGSWDFILPTCVQCPTLASPDAGNVSLSTDGSTSTAVYTCTSGYYMDGVSMATCNTSGLWNSLPPTCKCVQPASPGNGSYLISDDGLTLIYSCNVGFTMSGSAIRSCDTEGSGWSGQAPICVVCEEILTNSSVSLSLNGTTSTAEFTCEAGYSIVGSFSLVCGDNGTWSGDFPTCEKCSGLIVPENGSITLQTNGTASSVAFTCSVGTTLVGESEAICTDSGVWSFQEPVCSSCPALSDPLNGAVSMETDGSVTTATFTCNNGYRLTGDSILTCNSNGTWNAPSPECECELFVAILNGNMNITKDGMKAVYTCEEGYTLSGETEIDCAVNNSAVSLPTCITCVTLQTLSGASVTTSTDGAVTVAVVSCDVGYTMNGENVIACRSDGSWNISIPSCVVCETLQATYGINISMTSDGVVTRAIFSCPYGFTLNGSTETECRTDGTWSFETPSCECDSPDPLNNGDVDVSNDGLTASYTCNLGYSLNGPISRSCSIDGSWWSGSKPNCSECEATLPSDGLNKYLSTNGISTVAFFQCEHGYTISHTRNLTCLSNGSWDDTEPICVSCPGLNVSTGLSYEMMSDGFTTTAALSCAVGYIITGPRTRKCLKNGTWESFVPSCSIESTVTPTECEDQNSGAAIGLGLAFAAAAILAIILAVVAWRYRKLYRKLGGSKANQYAADQPNWILHDTDRLAPSKAPVGHQHHVTDFSGMSRESSKAPLSFSKHNLESDIIPTPSPALMTSKRLKGPKLSRGLTSATFFTESTNLSAYGSKYIDTFGQSSPLSDTSLVPRKEKEISYAFTEVPTLKLDESSSFRPVKQEAKVSTALSEQKFTTLSPSSILMSHDTIRGDSPLPQQILTPRDDEEIKKEQMAKKNKQQGKKASSSKPEASPFAEKRSGSTLYNDTISSKLKKRSKDFVDTGVKGMGMPSVQRSQTPSPSFKQVDVTDLEYDTDDVGV